MDRQQSFCTMTARLSLTMIVKNEAATLGRCLSSVRDLVDEIVVVDTGSCDNTKDIARQHGARIFDFPWCDNFTAARNEAIRQATGQWLLWLDADFNLGWSYADLGRQREAEAQHRALIAESPDMAHHPESPAHTNGQASVAR
jgi:hypothetical protein